MARRYIGLRLRRIERFRVSARKGHELQKLTEEAITATAGAMASFRQDNPESTTLSAWIVIPDDADAVEADLTDAERRGAHVFKDGEDGLTGVVAASREITAESAARREHFGPDRQSSGSPTAGRST